LQSRERRARIERRLSGNALECGDGRLVRERAHLDATRIGLRVRRRRVARRRNQRDEAGCNGYRGASSRVHGRGAHRGPTLRRTLEGISGVGQNHTLGLCRDHKRGRSAKFGRERTRFRIDLHLELATKLRGEPLVGRDRGCPLPRVGEEAHPASKRALIETRQPKRHAHVSQNVARRSS
jgi:hypothetical protein